MNAFLADVLVVIHLIVVLFMIFGLVFVLVGWPLKWRWIRNPWFRLSHLGIMAYIAYNAIIGEYCFLTRWESDLRKEAGQIAASGRPVDDEISFVGRLFRDVLYIDVPQSELDPYYLAFGAVLLVSILFVPPRFRRRKDDE